MQTFNSGGVNSLVVKVEHLGIVDESKVFEGSINVIVNRVYKRQYTGQPATFFMSAVVIKYGILSLNDILSLHCSLRGCVSASAGFTRKSFSEKTSLAK